MWAKGFLSKSQKPDPGILKDSDDEDEEIMERMSADDAWLFPIVRMHFVQFIHYLDTSFPTTDGFRGFVGAVYNREIPWRDLGKLVVGLVFLSSRCGECLECE